MSCCVNESRKTDTDNYIRRIQIGSVTWTAFLCREGFLCRYFFLHSWTDHAQCMYCCHLRSLAANTSPTEVPARNARMHPQARTKTKRRRNRGTTSPMTQISTIHSLANCGKGGITCMALQVENLAVSTCARNARTPSWASSTRLKCIWSRTKVDVQWKRAAILA